MLRQNSSKRLGHRKSTSSANIPQPVDPEISRQYAQTAATLAFERAEERRSADIGRRSDGPRGNNFSSSHQDQQHNSRPGQAASNFVKRQHSVRFAGPNAVQTSVHRRQSVNARVLHIPPVPRPSPASLRPMAMTTNDPVPAAYRPPSRSSSIGKASAGRTTAENYETALAAYNEYYTQEDDAPSTPSSYRRIRRSKSMFSPLKAPDVFYNNGTPEQPVSAYHTGGRSIANSHIAQIDPPTAALRAPRSMSFLRTGRDHLTPGLRERKDEAVQMARDRFFHQATQQRLREQPSFLFRTKDQRHEKPFRQSVRTSSSNSYGIPIASANQPQQHRESRLKEKARRASKSIKDKIKRAFGWIKEDPVEIPNQQVDAHETHVRRYPADKHIANNSFDSIPHPDGTTLHRVASRLPSIRPADSTQELKSDVGSIKSFQSDHSDGKSRVTSWNSTGVNTIASHGARLQSERDQQRLSIINENGTHVPSSSFHRQKIHNQFSAYPLIHRPNKSPSPISPPPPPGAVDSARVYSALMKRLDENSPKAKLEAAQRASLENLNAPKPIPQRSSSVHSSRASQKPATIRPVPVSASSSDNGCTVKYEHQWVKADALHAAHAENLFGNTGPHIHQWAPADSLREARMRNQDDVFSPMIRAVRPGDAPNRKENTQIASHSGCNDSAAKQEASITASYHTVPENFELTPQEIASRNEPLFQGERTIRETKSTFFGGSSCTAAKTQSPFRRALAEADYNANRGVSISVDDFPIPNPLNIRGNSRITAEFSMNNQHEVDRAYTESIYSRTTSGQILGAQSSSTLPLPEDEVPEMQLQNTSTGDVVILDRATYRPAMPHHSSHRATSSAGSLEWKTWMSSEVAKLERAKDQNSTGSYVNYALPTMPKSFHAGHIREIAQINDDDTDIAQGRVNAVRQPLGMIQQNAAQNMQHNVQNPPLLRPILKNKSVVSLVSGAEFTNTSPPIPIPPPPPIPSRSSLRPVHSKSSLRSVNTVNTIQTARTQSAPNSAVRVPSVTGRNVLHKRNVSQNTLHSTKSLDTPGKLVKRSIRKVSNTSATPSPGVGLAVTVEKQFGSTSTYPRPRTPGTSWSANRENHNPQQREDVYGTDGAGLTGPVMASTIQEMDAQQMGSKRMVDLFLSSRRKRMASEGESDLGSVFI